MIGTYAAALVVCGASLAIGQAALALCGARRWSWLAPAVGLALLLALCWGTARLPGEGLASAVAVLVVSLAAAAFLIGRGAHGARSAKEGRRAWWGRPEGVGEALRAGLPVGLLALAAASLPFVVEGRFGILGTGFDPDMSQHLLAADRLAGGEGSELLRQGYPLGPHAVAVALNQGLGTGLVQGFDGLAVAVAVLAPLTALAAFAELPAPRRTAGALLVGIPYLVASYYAQGAFKETIQALFVLAFVLALREASRNPEWRDLPLRFLPAALIAAGSVYAYSFPGLAWLLATAAIWALLEYAIARHPDPDPEAPSSPARSADPSGPTRSGHTSDPARSVDLSGLARSGDAAAGTSAGGAGEGVSSQARRPVFRPTHPPDEARASGEKPSARLDTPSPAPPAGRSALALALIVFAVLVAPELGRMAAFGGFETFDPNGPGLGNLFGQISPLEALGIWPSGDFRVAPGDGAAPAVAFYLGAAFALALLALGVARCRRRAETAVLAGLLAAAGVYAAARLGGTPYTAAKALEVAAPLVALTVLLPLLGFGRDRDAGRFRGTAPARAAFLLAAAGCSLLALANAPVGPASYSPALTGLWPLLAADSTLVLAPDRLLDEEHGLPYIAWELRGGRVCVEPESAKPDRLPPGVRFVVAWGARGGPPFPGLILRRRAGPYLLWERPRVAGGPGPCPLVEVRQARRGPAP